MHKPVIDPSFRSALRTALVAGSAIVAALSVAPATVSAAELPPRLVVGFATGQNTTDQVRTLRGAGVEDVTAKDVRSNDVPALGVASVEVASEDLREVARDLLGKPGVEYVEVDRVARTRWTPNDDQISGAWALPALGAFAAWDIARGSGVKIAVIDTGVDYIHPELAGKVELGWDYVDDDADPMDEQGHGTHVAGAAAGIADNGTGIAGMAPDATILAMRALDQQGSGYYSWIASAITTSVDRGAKVINLSLGGAEGSTLLAEAVAYAAAHGAIVTCASGNEGAGVVGFPARYDGCVAVGATDQADGVAAFSNQGAGLDVTAPGTGILSSVPGAGYDAWDGTSMATPYVSGLAALLFSQGLSRAQVESVMFSTAKDLGAPGYDTGFGHGRIDAAAAVAAAAGVRPAVADTLKPSIARVGFGKVSRSGPRKYRGAWRRQRATGWKVVGVTDRRGSYRWKRTRKARSKKVVTEFRIANRKVYRRVVTWRMKRVAYSKGVASLPIVVTATDDVGIDRVGVSVDGHWVGTDWNGADGWSVNVACTTGTHTYTVRAFDAANNVATSEVRRTVAC